MELTDTIRLWCVYMHKNKINNKIYIGITSRVPEDRWGKNGIHYTKSSHPVFYNAIQKYGWDNFEHIIVESNLTEDEAKEKEIELIALYKTNCQRYTSPTYGYNMTDGGDWNPMIGNTHTCEAKQKISNASKTMWANPEFRQRACDQRKGKLTGPDNPMYGKVVSEETRQKISKSSKDRWADPDYRKKCMQHLVGQNNPFYGKHHTEETKRKISESRIGVYAGENSPNYGKGRSVVQLTTNKEFIAKFKTIKDASKETGVNKGNISNACRGWYKSAGGYKWMYEEDYIQQTG